MVRPLSLPGANGARVGFADLEPMTDDIRAISRSDANAAYGVQPTNAVSGSTSTASSVRAVAT